MQNIIDKVITQGGHINKENGHRGLSDCTLPTDKTFESVENGNTNLPVASQGSDRGNLQNKIGESLVFIEDCLKSSSNQICLCSFGKDSLVLLHLILQIKKIPVIYWREPFFQSKFAHPQQVAEKWGIDVYDYPPSMVDYFQNNDYFDVFNFYDIGNGDTVNLYTGLRNYKDTDERVLCTVKELLMRPKITGYGFQWDCIFHGHKQVDPVYIAEKIELPKVKLLHNKLLSLPIRDWTNEDIWEYIHKYDLPYNKDRYDLKDESKNNDLYPACHDCLDCRNLGKNVYCKELKREIPCVAKTPEQNEQFRQFLLGKTYK